MEIKLNKNYFYPIPNYDLTKCPSLHDLIVNLPMTFAKFFGTAICQILSTFWEHFNGYLIKNYYG